MIFLSDGHDNHTYGKSYKEVKEHDLVMQFNNIIEDYFNIAQVDYIRITADYRNATEENRQSSKVLALRYKVAQINRLSKQTKFPIAIETHFNGAWGKGTGYEILYHYKSEISKKVALEMLKKLKDFEIVSTLRDRGLKPKKTKWFLRGTLCPAIILEPFFLDRDTQYYEDIRNFEMLAVAYAHTIVKVYNEYKEAKE